MSTVLNIGKRLRALRVQNGQVIDDIAAISGLSRAYISQVETGKASPSLQTVDKLAAALQVPLADLFAADGDFKLQLIRARERQIMQFGAEESPESMRKLIHFLSAPNRVLEMVMIEIPVGYAADHIDRGHEGEEVLYVLQGRIKAVHGRESHILQPGDSLHWLGTTPHAIENAGKRKAKLMIARTPAGFMDLRFDAMEIANG